MPERSETLKPARACGDENPTAGRGPGQMGWYNFAQRFTAGRSVLDVGCGTGKGLDLLAETALEASGQDLDPQVERPGVFIGPLSDLPSNSVDVVTAIDVIEHVAEPESFLFDLLRIARVGIFLSTPNWAVSRCKWPYHLREYTPREWFDLLHPLGRPKFFKGSACGDEVYPIKHERAFRILNELRVWHPTAFATRCFNHILLQRMAIICHIAVWLEK